MVYHWNSVSSGERADTWEDFIDEVRRMKKGQIWRHNQAGDLAGSNGVIDKKALRQLVLANKGKRGFTYTHYLLTAPNAEAIAKANAGGFTINLSADSLKEADELASLGIAPVVAIVPVGWKGDKTPGGRKVTMCPAQTMEYMTCAVCQLCQKPDRHAVVAFEAHGSKKAAVTRLFHIKSIKTEEIAA